MTMMQAPARLAGAVVAASLLAAPASALPAAPAATATSLTAAMPNSGEVIQVRRRGWVGGAIAGGLVGGLLAGALAAQAAPYYYYAPPPPAPYPAYRAYDPAIEYCLSRFRSYDPYSMTYLGYDGYRHPCP